MKKFKSYIKNYFNKNRNKYFINGEWIDLNQAQIDYLEKRNKYMPYRCVFTTPWVFVIADIMGTERFGMWKDLFCKIIIVLLVVFIIDYFFSYDIVSNRLMKLKEDKSN